MKRLTSIFEESACAWLAVTLLSCTLGLPSRSLSAQSRGACATHPKQAATDHGCFHIEDLARRWPPVDAQIAFRDEANQQLKTFDFGGVSYDKVNVLASVCFNSPDRGQVAFIAFETAETREEGRAVLAQFTIREGKLELLGPLGPADTKHTELTLEDVTGDSQPEVIFSAIDEIEVWAWKKGRLGFLLHSQSDYPYELSDPTGDGNCLLIIWRKPPGVSQAKGLRWPAGAYRWFSDRFAPVLVPSLYADAMAVADEKLPHESTAEFLIAMGKAYQILGKTDQARERFAQAWEPHQKDPPLPPCSEPGDAVQDYYDAINESDLVRAYKHLGPELQRGFAEFAAGFARTQSVAVMELGQAQAGTTGIASVPVTIRATDLTLQGPATQAFSGSWRVRRSDCALLGSRMHKSPAP